MTTFVGVSIAWGATSSSSQTDAQFRARCQAFHDALAGAGLVQTADTGQINLTTVLNPDDPSIDRGYEIWRFNDAQQGVDPIFIKVTYGSAGATSRTRFKVQVGQGSNGSGTLTGQVTGTFNMGSNEANTDATITGTFYACHAAGFFGITCIPSGAYAQPFVCFTIARTKDSSLAFDGLGAILFGDNESAAGWCQSVRWGSSPGNYGSSPSVCIIPGLPASTALLSGDKQLYPHFYGMPDIKQMWHQFAIRMSELSTLPTSFSAAPIGGVTRTFLCGGTRGLSGASNGSATWQLAFIWE